MAYKILHLPTATYMYYSLHSNGKTDTSNFYTQHEVDNGLYYFESGALTLFKTKSMAKRFLDKWDMLKQEDNNGDTDELQFDYDKSYTFQRCHFSIIKVKDEM